MNDIRDNHVQFEAVKVAMTQNKDGHILRLAVNPVDTPEEVMRDFVGQRYMVVLVKLADDGGIVKLNEEGDMAVKLAGMLCRNEDFQQWLYKTNQVAEMTERAATEAIRSYTGVKSRAEYKTSKSARDRLFALRDEFRYAVRAK